MKAKAKLKRVSREREFLAVADLAHTIWREHYAGVISGEQIEYMLEHFRVSVDKRDILQDARIEYEIGLAESETDDVYRIRGLLSRAYGAQMKYTSQPEE